MSDIRKGLYTLLQTKSGVTDLIKTRLTPDVLPQNQTMPAATMTVISGDSAHHLGGGEGNATERIQFDCYDTTRGGANDLAEAIRVELHGYRGAAGDETIQSCLLDGRRYDVDRPIDGAENWRKRVIMDFVVIHTEAATTT